MVKRLTSSLRAVIKTDFVKVSTWSAFSTLVKMISGMISTKIVAWSIGATGMGIVGNFLNAVNILSMLSTGGIGQGVTKYVAENYDKPDRQKIFIANAVRITLACTILVSLLVISFNRLIGKYIFHTDAYNSIVILFGASLILYSFNMLFIYIINGYKAYKKFVRINVVSSIASLAVSVFLVLYFGMEGALSATIAAQSVIIVVAILYVRKEEWFRNIFASIKIDWKVWKLLGGFTVMTIVSTFMVQFAQLSVRSYIGTRVSLHDAGLWESMNRISAMYLMIVTTSISTYYLPRLAEIREDSVLRQEIFKTMKIILPPLALACIIIFFSRDIIVWILYTKEFYSVRELFGVQMIGDFFKMASWLIAFLFWAKAMARTFIFTEIFFSLGLIFLSRLFIDQYGVKGAVYAYAVNYFIYFLLILFIFRKLLFKTSKS